MAYEFRSSVGVVRLARVLAGWWIECGGAQSGPFRSAEAAAAAIAARQSGLPALDETPGVTNDADLIDWTPLGESL